MQSYPEEFGGRLGLELPDGLQYNYSQQQNEDWRHTTQAIRPEPINPVHSSCLRRFSSIASLHGQPIPAAIKRSAVIDARRQQATKTPFTATAGTAVTPQRAVFSRHS